MSDRIRVDGLSIQARVGIYPHERVQRQRIFVDLELETDLSVAGRSDRIGATLDYDLAAELAREVAEKRHHALIESLAEEVAAGLLERFAGRVERVRVRVTKPSALADARAVSVEIERHPPAGPPA